MVIPVLTLTTFSRYARTNLRALKWGYGRVQNTIIFFLLIQEFLFK